MTNSVIKGTVSEFKHWMDRGIGRWLSRRRYLMGKHLNSGEYTTEFETESLGDQEYRITWSGVTDGEMDLELVGNKLNRSRSYFGPEDGTTYQTMYWIDPDTVVFHTAYDGDAYREEIRYLDNDTRLRQTVGRDQETNTVTLVGQYYEVRID